MEDTDLNLDELKATLVEDDDSATIHGEVGEGGSAVSLADASGDVSEILATVLGKCTLMMDTPLLTALNLLNRYCRPLIPLPLRRSFVSIASSCCQSHVQCTCLNRSAIFILYFIIRPHLLSRHFIAIWFLQALTMIA